MDTLNLAKKLEGLQTISSISKTLKINKKTAINYVSLLRKNGFVRNTFYGSRKVRMYKISNLKQKNFGYNGFYEILNKYSRVKIYSLYEKERVYTKLSIEEVIIRSIKTKNFRVILASLDLFSKIKSWIRLNYYAKRENLGRKVGALYDVARIVIRVKRMDKRIRNSLLRSKIKSKYFVKKIKSKDLNEIEKRWKVYLPFNKADLGVYKE